MNLLYSIFALTIFTSSFLLFQVQPLLGKHILPWFGGSSEVWITAMLFFMVALAVGYIYAQILSRLKIWSQMIIHITVIIVSVILIKEHTLTWSSAITPSFDSLSLDFSDPALAVLKTLTISIGLPFALLSSSSSLLQMWYANISGREPFSLYGISNIGSFLGLLSYPLFFERFYPTYVQGELWGYGFIAYVALVLVVLYTLLLFHRKATKVKVRDVSIASPTNKDFFVWMGITAVPVMVMLSGTSFMTVSIASVPFLWVGPLALYLLSFAITFRSGRRLPMWANEVFLVAISVVAVFMVLLGDSYILMSVAVVHLALFAVYHWCHEHLYALRPDPVHLTTFYVALALGGIVGSLLIKISNNYLLVIPIELILLLVASVALVFYQWFRKGDYHVPAVTSVWLKRLSVFVLACLVFGSALNIYNLQDDTLVQKRNFFGYKAVIEKENNDNIKIVSLQHGKTNHGFQVYEDGKPRTSPVSYYSGSSGIAKVFAYKREEKPNGIKVAVAGLGGGALTAYCEPEDDFTFFEIDPEMIEISKNYFTYLDHCQQLKINLIDARLGLQKQSEESDAPLYDLIILDAYADDAMPIHLMTSEAIDLYKSLLTEEGILAVHISSRYLNLLPVIKAVAKDSGLSARYRHNSEPKEKYANASIWTILVKDENIFDNDAFSEVSTFDKVEKEVLWTDTFSALLPVVRW